MHAFHLPEDRVMEMEYNERLDWFEKAVDLEARQAAALQAIFHGGDYQSPYDLPEQQS